MTNSTDLHIQYHMETGEDHQWWARSTGSFHSMENYSREYAKWLEEKLLEKREHTDSIENLHELLDYAETEIQNANREIADLEEKNAWYEDQIEYYSARDGGGQ